MPTQKETGNHQNETEAESETEIRTKPTQTKLIALASNGRWRAPHPPPSWKGSRCCPRLSRPPFPTVLHLSALAAEAVEGAILRTRPGLKLTEHVLLLEGPEAEVRMEHVRLRYARSAAETPSRLLHDEVFEAGAIRELLRWREVPPGEHLVVRSASPGCGLSGHLLRTNVHRIRLQCPNQCHHQRLVITQNVLIRRIDPPIRSNLVLLGHQALKHGERGLGAACKEHASIEVWHCIIRVGANGAGPVALGHEIPMLRTCLPPLGPTLEHANVHVQHEHIYPGLQGTILVPALQVHNVIVCQGVEPLDIAKLGM
mmetsp:Transcript_20118/g.35943  ORF Transcript_20118/g.35943 Transcript_20118/m.35943 type:complete len:314 (-) Transcript_20118:60-1001(-)